MRCECCNNPLSYKETTARFKTLPDEPRRYVCMCSKCIREALPGIPIIMRNDLPDDDADDVFDYTAEVKNVTEFYDDEE